MRFKRLSESNSINTQVRRSALRRPQSAFPKFCKKIKKNFGKTLDKYNSLRYNVDNE